MERVDLLFDLRRKGLGDLQGENELFLFAEKGIQRFDESRFYGPKSCSPP